MSGVRFANQVRLRTVTNNTQTNTQQNTKRENGDLGSHTKAGTQHNATAEGLLPPGILAQKAALRKQQQEAAQKAKEEQIGLAAYQKVREANPHKKYYSPEEVLDIKRKAIEDYRRGQGIQSPASAFTEFAKNASCAIMGGRRKTRSKSRKSRKSRKRSSSKSRKRKQSHL
jgi:hypothetical protein